jgi:aryl-alcohol dehydrogenase-like predicted oxidoreductase
MQRRRVGSTGLLVSRLGLGTMSWATQTDEHEAREQLLAFVAAGGSLVDTSESYGDGSAEAQLGQLIDDVVARDDLVISISSGTSRRGARRSVDTSRGSLIRGLDQSLARLGVDNVDLWQVAHWSDDAPLEETLAALDHAVSSGRAAYVGIANYTGWQTARAATWQAAVPGRIPLASAQVEYSLLNRHAEAEVLPAARALGLGVLPWSPLGRGVLTGKYRTGIPVDSRAASDAVADFVKPYLDQRAGRVVEATVRAAEGLGWSPLEVALVWVRDREGVTAPIIGPRTAAQLAAAVATETLVLPAELVAALDDVSAP